MGTGQLLLTAITFWLPLEALARKLCNCCLALKLAIHWKAALFLFMVVESSQTTKFGFVSFLLEKLETSQNEENPLGLSTGKHRNQKLISNQLFRHQNPCVRFLD